MIQYNSKEEALATKSKSFIWKEFDNSYFLIEQMQSWHLFEVLVTLWNKNVKEGYKVEEYLPGNFWDEKTSHTRKYVLQCLEAVLKELSDRKDLNDKASRTVY